uniref:kelch-like ECH-associated protein 1A isoform X2 n=1 Tax=Doryrhamphus excisus TaxID=161450 RepID=UPI0025ADC8CB|nr:kelch-like ECH-associated protein 1A isoform X2 [Doryrhamphus excisus]
MQCSLRKKTLGRGSDFSAIAVPSMHGSGYLDYTVESHASKSLHLMDEFRRQEMLCDLVLHVTHKEKSMDFKVHKVVLASCSPYFRAMFTSSFKECHASEVTLRDVCPQVVGRLIDFAYTSHIIVGEKCVLHVLLGAMRFQMEDVAKACCDYLTKHLESSNVIGITRFAEEIGCVELYKQGREYINTHFSEVYKACTDWVRWDMENRAQYLHALLNAVHIYALPPKFLKNQLLSCPILSKANACKDFLSKIFQEMTLRKVTPAPIRGTQLIYVAGGYRQHSLATMEAFDPRRKVWIKLADMAAPSSGLAACSLFGLLYTVGGRNLSLENNTESDMLCCYNPMTNQWSQRAPLNTPRNRLGVAVVDGCIYAVGGSQGSTLHNTVERWDPESNRWSYVCPMSVARMGSGVAACGGALYVVGGLDGPNRSNATEKYQPDTNTWHQLAPMTTVRSGLGLVCVNSYLYAIGGYDGHHPLATVERYNIARNMWEPKAAMQSCRSAHSVAVHQGRIFVLGGFNQHDFLSSVECYCPEKNEWMYVTEMSIGRSGMGVAVTMEPCPGSLPDQEEDDDEQDATN